MKREEELTAAGWEKRFEVHLEPLPSKEEMDAESCESSGCTACFDADSDRYRIIYTRRAGDR